VEIGRGYRLVEKLGGMNAGDLKIQLVLFVEKVSTKRIRRRRKRKMMTRRWTFNVVNVRYLS
jgi:hypothetical protein